MTVTPKMERNGVPGPTETHNTAGASADITALVAATMGSATAIAAQTVVNGDPMVHSAAVVDWETGVAGHDMPGEA